MKSSVFNLTKIEFNCLKLKKLRKVIEHGRPQDNVIKVTDYINDVIKVI